MTKALKNSLTSSSPLTINCPVCQTTFSGSPLYRYTAQESAACFCPPSRNYDRYQRLTKVIQNLWSDNECVVMHCPECEFAFGYPFVGGDEAFYQILHEQKGYPAWRWDYDIAIRDALNPIGGGRVLDVGAGVGMFLQKLPSTWQRFAVESSEITRDALRQKDIHVFQDLSSATSTATGTFQVITLFQVLEHISEFKMVLEQCRSLLVSGGCIVITVPDGEAMIRQEKLTGCPDMPPNHIGKWTEKSLTLALRNAGFIAEPAIFEPSSLRNLRGALHLKVMADATHPDSLAAQIYRISHKPLRSLLLAGAGAASLPKLLPNVHQLVRGGAFAMVAKAL